MNQHEQIADFIYKHGSITPMDAFRELGITKLATRISEMIRLGIPIAKIMIYDENRDGKPIKYMRYSMGARSSEKR